MKQPETIEVPVAIPGCSCRVLVGTGLLARTGELAREAGTSRSVLSERFSALVGQPPIDYLAHYRIARAAERLRLSDDCIAAVACDSGYESEAAFHRAFKRIMGVAPGRWREKPAQPRQHEAQARETG